MLIQLEDLGFCDKRTGGRFVSDSMFVCGIGWLPINTDAGGLCNNHLAYRGAMSRVIQVVRQLRGDAHPKIHVENCDLALAHGSGGLFGSRTKPDRP